MPRHKPPLTLVQLSSLKLAALSMDLVNKAEIDSDFLAEKSLEHFSTLPSLILHQILDRLIENYVTLCQVSKIENLVHLIQQGDLSRQVPRLKTIFDLHLSSNVTHLDFTGLLKLGTLSSGAFAYFHQILSESLKKLPNLLYLNLKSPNSRTSLPSVSSEHLKIAGACCPKLKFLDLSFNTGLKNEDLLCLLPKCDHLGCADLETLYIFDCGFSDKVVKNLVSELQHLKNLGYKEMGRVLKKVHKEKANLKLRLSHINHMGGKIRKTSVSSLRCKKSIIEAIHALCPQVSNLKARVQDADVEHLSMLKFLTSVELCYNVGRPTTPALCSASFFQLQGAQLTSVALICSAISMVHIQMLGKNCPNLASLWLRSNHFQVTKYGRDELPEDLRPNEGCFRRLQTLYFRVGEGELALTFVPHYVLSYVLKNAQDLKELTVALRCNVITDDYICGLLIDCNLYRLEKVLIVVPGLNNYSGVIALTVQTLQFILDFCPLIKTLGNVLSWAVKDSELEEIRQKYHTGNYDLNIISRHMTMH